MELSEVIKNGMGPAIRVYKESADTETDNIDAEEVEEPNISGYIEPEAFIGEYPFEVIIEGLRNQFANYISTEDETNYVDVFYQQMKASYAVADEQDLPDDWREGVDKKLDQFLAVMQELFNTKLAITLNELDGSADNNDSVEFTLRTLYDFFILNAKETFQTVITKVVCNNFNTNVDDRAFYKEIRARLESFSPIILDVRPTQFLKYCKRDDIIEMFEDGRVSGNFLRKYSPRLYKNEEYESHLIAHIQSILDWVKEVKADWVKEVKEGGEANAE